jgi:hypothetical protein
MGLDRTILERQLALAQSELTACESTLSGSGTEQGEFKRDPQWRSLNARRRQIATRLQSAGKIEKRNADLEQRRAAKASGEGDEE